MGHDYLLELSPDILQVPVEISVDASCCLVIIGS